MKMQTGSAGLGLLVAGLLAAARTSGAQSVSAAGPNAALAMPAPATSLGADAVAGRETFTQYCSICHGVGARGFIGPHIAGINWTVPGLHGIVRGGVGGYGGMPAFNAHAVTDKNIADIAAYLASLPSASAPKSATLQQTTAFAATPASPSKIASAAQPVLSGAGDPAKGRQVFTANCAACHGASAQGGIGPSLRAEKTRKDTAAALAWIKNPGPPMPKLYPSVLSEKDVEDVAAYVESL
jgi:mono/diheme cytochrome c family protein